MRVVYFGSPQFAADILSEVAEHFEVVAVYTMPDMIRGRGNALLPTPVKRVALSLNLPVETPRTLKDDDVIEKLSLYKPDVICVAAYGAILTDSVINLPPLGCLNVHASLLPRWRGAAPIERAILAGDEEVGVCVMRMTHDLDAGDYCVRRSIPVAGQTTQRLTKELANLGALALITTLTQLENGNAYWVVQDESQVTYANKIKKGELDLSPNLSVVQNLRNVQASSDTHISKCSLAGRRVRVLSAAPVDSNVAILEIKPGQLMYRNQQLIAGCLDGAFAITFVKPDGKREMSAAAFAAGIPALKQEILEGGFSDE